MRTAWAGYWCCSLGGWGLAFLVVKGDMGLFQGGSLEDPEMTLEAVS